MQKLHTEIEKSRMPKQNSKDKCSTVLKLGPGQQKEKHKYTNT